MNEVSERERVCGEGGLRVAVGSAVARRVGVIDENRGSQGGVKWVCEW